MKRRPLLLVPYLMHIATCLGQTPTLVKDIYPLSGDGLGPLFKRDWATVIDNKLIFAANNSTHGSELWLTDGSEGGTVMLKDIRPGDRGASSQPNAFFTHNGTAYFACNEPGLWRTDGTTTGTYVVWKDRNGYQQPHIETSTDFYFLLPSGSLIHKDPTGTGTAVAISKQLADPIQNVLLLNGPKSVARLGNKWLFLAELGREHIRTLMVSDETKAGTYSLNTGVEGLVGQVIGMQLEGAGSNVFFVNDDGRTGTELWVTDGSQSGTHLVKNIGPGGVEAKGLRLQLLFAALPTGLIFTVGDVTSGATVWFSDGTEAGTKPIKQPAGTAAGGSNAVYGCTAPTTGEVYFFYGSFSELTLWRTNGTAAGTTLAFKLPAQNALVQDAGKPYFQSVNGFTYFLTQTSSPSGSTLHNVWRIDERAGRVTKVGILPNCVSAPYFQAVGNTLYYVGRTQQTGSELWKLPLPQQPLSR